MILCTWKHTCRMWYPIWFRRNPKWGPGPVQMQPRAGSNATRFESNAAAARPLDLSVLFSIDLGLHGVVRVGRRLQDLENDDCALTSKACGTWIGGPCQGRDLYMHGIGISQYMEVATGLSRNESPWSLWTKITCGALPRDGWTPRRPRTSHTIGEQPSQTWCDPDSRSVHAKSRRVRSIVTKAGNAMMWNDSAETRESFSV